MGDPGRNAGEVTLTGMRISPGLGMGVARIAGIEVDLSSPSLQIDPSGVEGELMRLRSAFQHTRDELEESARRIDEQFSPALGGIFHAHVLMLDSFASSREIEEEIRRSLLKAEGGVAVVFRRWEEKFLDLNNETFQQRADDIADIERRVITHLRGSDDNDNMHEGGVLVFQRLLPSDIVRLNRKNTSAIIVRSLGLGSHAALLAREKGIPTVANLPEFDRIMEGDDLLVDGSRGVVVRSPADETRSVFEERIQGYQSTLARCKVTCRLPARTVDGTVITVEGNIGVSEDVALVIESGADGVGLFRIEELYLTRNHPPTGEELEHELRSILAPLHRKNVTVRLLDIGGDKQLPFLRFPQENNPALGRRGVRMLLEFSELTRTQLEVLLRLSQDQHIRVLVPMVTLEEDIQTMRAHMSAIASELGIRKLPPFGAMIETPAAALNIPALAKHVDFLCVGTNDLAQYTLAAGRDDPAVNRYYVDNHASILRLLSIINAEAGETPLTLCGELAGREEVIPALLGMGFRSISIAPGLIPTSKELIRTLRISSKDAVAIP